MSDNNPPSQPSPEPNPAPLAKRGSGVENVRGLMEFDGDFVDERHELGSARRVFSPRVLLRYKWTIAGVFTLTAALALSVIWMWMTPMYEASADLHVRSSIPRFISHTDETGQIPTSQYERYRLSQIEIIKNPEVLDRVLDRVEVRERAWYRQTAPWYASLRGGSPSLLERLLDAMSVVPIRRTELIRVSVTTHNPTDAQVIANVIIAEYIKFVSEQFSEEDRQIFAGLNAEEQRLKGDIGFAEAVVTEARNELLTPSPDELIASRRVRLDELEAEVDDLAFEISILEEQQREIEAVSAASQPAGDSSDATAADYERDPEWRRLYGEWKQAQQSAEGARTRFGPKSDMMIQAEQAVEFAHASLERHQAYLNRLAELDALSPTTTPGREGAATSSRTLRNEIDRLNSLLQMKQGRVEELRDSFKQQFSTAESLRRNSNILAQKKEELQRVLDRRQELMEKGRVPPSIQPIAEARLPAAPNEDKRKKLSLAALFGALAAGLGAGYLRWALNPQVQEASEVEREVHGAFLGHMPLQRHMDMRSLADSPMHAEAARMVRTALLNRLSGACNHAVQVTSAGPGSGKSTVSILLARSLAQSGKSVLLVDADLRRPSLAKYFTIDASPGLINVLSQHETEARVIRATTIPQLSILTAGGMTRNEDVELLADGAFSSLLEHWRKQFDLVLLDSSPLLSTADGAILSRQVNGTVLVVRERHCRRSALVEALATLSAAGGKLLGTVFVGSGHGGTYAYGYDYHYESLAQPLDVHEETPQRADG